MSVFVQLRREFSYACAEDNGRQKAVPINAAFELRSFGPLQLSEDGKSLIPSDPHEGDSAVIVDSFDAADVGPCRNIPTRNNAVVVHVPYLALMRLVEAVGDVNSEIYGKVIDLTPGNALLLRQQYAKGIGVFEDCAPQPAA